MKTRALLECLGRAALIGLGLAAFSSTTPAQPSKAQAPVQAGQFFTIVEPINDEVIERVRTSALPAIEQATAKGARPTLVFEFRPGETRPGQSSFGASSDLATFLATRLTGARQTVAYVPEPLSGYAVLAVLACDEIIMGPDASLGPISPEGEPITPRERETVRELARLKPRDPDLLLGMLAPNADLREIRTADRQVHYVLADRLPEFEKQHQVVENQPAWEGGRRGILTVERARQGFVRLVAEDRAKIAEAFNLASTSDDPTLGGPVSPILIRIEGAIDQVKESYVRRRIGQAFKEGDNLIIFDIDSEGGLDHPADTIAETIVNLKDIRTVAYINEHATGVATLIALACDEIVFHKGGRLGNLTQLVDGSKPDPLDDRMTAVLAKRAFDLAQANGHPGALARAMVDPNVEVLSARDAKTGAV
ncbi:MAG: serine protease, partial [Isosphaeraceae bacterium]